MYSVAYVEEIFNTAMITMEKNLNDAKEELKKMTPPPINSMLQKQYKQDAIKTNLERKQLKAVHVPPTAPGKCDYLCVCKCFATAMVIW